MTTAVKPPTRYQRWRHAIVTPELIYGTLLINSIIAVADDDEPAWVVLFFVVLGAIVFYLAHVFAGTIAHQGVVDERVVPIRQALAHSAHHSLGLLTAAVVPVVVLTTGLLINADPDTTQSIALGLALIILLVLGWQAMAERGARWYIRLLGSIITLFLGTFVILLEAMSH